MTEAELAGQISIFAEPLKQHPNAFRITVEVSNTSAVEHPEIISRDDVFPQSFLSTNIILTTTNGRFISHQNPGEEWIDAIADCDNKNAWPILVEEAGQSILASPIILYDYPKINPESRLDLFDSTEIQEALLLHVNLLSDAEKEQIAAADEKLRAMLDKVSQVTPEQLLNIHSGLRDTGEA
jgi:hydrogenase maturation protease